jgi:hypothetical protein
MENKKAPAAMMLNTEQQAFIAVFLMFFSWQYEIRV